MTTQANEWPISSLPSTEKERQVAEALFGAHGSHVPTDQLSAIAGSRDYAVKLVSEVRRKLLPGWGIERVGNGYQVIAPPPPPPSKYAITTEDVPVLLAATVVSDTLQQKLDWIDAEIGAMEQAIKAEQDKLSKLRSVRNNVEYAMLGIMEAMMLELPTVAAKLTIDKDASSEVR